MHLHAQVHREELVALPAIGLTRTKERLSASSAHLALTYDYIAGSAEEIVELTIETQKINDLIYIL